MDAVACSGHIPLHAHIRRMTLFACAPACKRQVWPHTTSSTARRLALAQAVCLVCDSQQHKTLQWTRSHAGGTTRSPCLLQVINVTTMSACMHTSHAASVAAHVKHCIGHKQEIMQKQLSMLQCQRAPASLLSSFEVSMRLQRQKQFAQHMLRLKQHRQAVTAVR